MTMCVSFNTINVQPTCDSLGKITWVDKIFYSRIKYQISFYGVQEYTVFGVLPLSNYVRGPLEISMTFEVNHAMKGQFYK